jgi:hypothetical protein
MTKREAKRKPYVIQAMADCPVSIDKRYKQVERKEYKVNIRDSGIRSGNTFGRRTAA